MMFDSLLEPRLLYWRMSPTWPRDSRGMMRLSLLRLLAIAHEQRLDVAALIANLAEEHRGINRWRLRQLARRILGGTSLVAALEQTPPLLNDRHVLAIRFGTETGTLPATYRDLIAEGSAEWTDLPGDVRQTGRYLIAMSLAILLIASFLFTFIFPTLNHLLEEFAMNESPPTAYAWTLEIDRHIGPTVVLFGLVVLGTILTSMTFGGSWSWSRHLASSRIRWIGQRRLADLLELLSRAVEAGRPLPSVLSSLGQYHFDRSIRNRLLFARNEIEQGADVWTGLRDARLLSPAESLALAAAPNPTAQAWLMRRLAHQKQERVVAVADALRQAAQTVAILAVAAVVLLLSCACYQFLAYLVDELSGIQ